ncbi:transglutaminase-like cysteine peptidase [Hydrogenophaga sp. OTU3427]|uniref:transglutaminase-like cysteine peptidase n=1 Tax=Hydrogenophaga sp. OTU3427 TaxID=3043856 RepID=UPI00313F3573
MPPHLRRFIAGSLPRPPQWVLAALCVAAVLFVGWTQAQTNLDRTQALALERYGQRAADVVAAWRKMMDDTRSLGDQEKLAAVNTFFNRRVLFESDIVIWKQNDYWATPLEFMGKGAGDCEDFSIAKYMTLQMLGVPAEKLRMIYVRARFGGPNSNNSEAHMVLGYFEEPTGEPVILDNLIGSIRPASSRTDLSPVFSFNGQGLWVAGQAASSGDPTARLSRWRDVLDRMKQEGL